MQIILHACYKSVRKGSINWTYYMLIVSSITAGDISLCLWKSLWLVKNWHVVFPSNETNCVDTSANLTANQMQIKRSRWTRLIQTVCKLQKMCGYANRAVSCQRVCIDLCCNVSAWALLVFTQPSLWAFRLPPIKTLQVLRGLHSLLYISVNTRFV